MATGELGHTQMGQDIPVIFSSVHNTYSTKFLVYKSVKAVKVVIRV